MASLSDYTADAVAGFIHSIVARARLMDGSLSGIVQCELDVDQARMIWAAAKHLDFLYDWGVGIEQTRFSLRECKAFIESQKNAAKEDKKLFLSRREILIMKDVAVHLDRLALMKEADSHSSNRRRKR